MGYESNLALVPVNDIALETIKQIEGDKFNKLIEKQHYLMREIRDKQGKVIGCDLFIKKAGLERKMEQKFGINFRVVLTPVTGEMYEHFKDAEGFKGFAYKKKEGEDLKRFAYVVFKAELYLNGGDNPSFTQYATASSENCRHGRYIEMAQTRATNRAYREATNCGFTSVEEINERESYEDFKARQVMTNPPSTPSTKELQGKLQGLMEQVQCFRFVNSNGKLVWNTNGIRDFTVKLVGKNITIPAEKETITVEEYLILIDEVDRMTKTIKVIEPEIEQQHLLSQIEPDEDDDEELKKFSEGQIYG